MWLVFLVMTAHAEPEVMFIDSRDDASLTWLMIEDCAVPIKKKMLKDLDFIEREVERICHLGLNGKPK